MLSTFNNIDPNDIYGSLDPFVFEMFEDIEYKGIEYLNTLEDKLLSSYINVWGYFNLFLSKHLEQRNNKWFFIESVNIEDNVINHCYVITLEINEIEQ